MATKTQDDYTDRIENELTKKLETYYPNIEISVNPDLMTVNVSLETEMKSKDIPLIQRDVDDFIEGNVYYDVESYHKYDLYDHIFLRPEGQLFKDICNNIDRDIENAENEAIEEWLDEHDSNGNYEPDPDREYEAMRDRELDMWD